MNFWTNNYATYDQTTYRAESLPPVNETTKIILIAIGGYIASALIFLLIYHKRFFKWLRNWCLLRNSNQNGVEPIHYATNTPLVPRLNSHPSFINAESIIVIKADPPSPLSSSKFPQSKYQIRSQGEENCSICLDEFRNEQIYVRLPCIHIFHPECIDEWFKKSKLCPLCKENVA